MENTIAESITRNWSIWLSLRRHITPFSLLLMLREMVRSVDPKITIDDLFTIPDLGAINRNHTAMFVVHPKPVGSNLAKALQLLCMAVFWGNDDGDKYVRNIGLSGSDSQMIAPAVMAYRLGLESFSSIDHSAERYSLGASSDQNAILFGLNIGRKALYATDARPFWKQLPTIDGSNLWIDVALKKHFADLWLTEDRADIAKIGYREAEIALSQGPSDILFQEDRKGMLDCLLLSLGACLYMTEGRKVAHDYILNRYKSVPPGEHTLFATKGVKELLNTMDPWSDLEALKYQGTILVYSPLLIPTNMQLYGLQSWLLNDTKHGTGMLFSDLRLKMALGSYSEIRDSTFWFGLVILNSEESKSYHAAAIANIITAGNPDRIAKANINFRNVAQATTNDLITELMKVCNRNPGVRTERLICFIQIYRNSFTYLVSGKPDVAIRIWHQVAALTGTGSVEFSVVQDLAGTGMKALAHFASVWPNKREQVSRVVALSFLSLRRRAGKFWRQSSEPIELVTAYADSMDVKARAVVVSRLINDANRHLSQMKTHWPIQRAFMDFIWTDGILNGLPETSVQRAVDAVEATAGSDDPARFVLWLYNLKERIDQTYFENTFRHYKISILDGCRVNSTHADICFRVLLSASNYLSDSEKAEIEAAILALVKGASQNGIPSMILLDVPGYLFEMLRQQWPFTRNFLGKLNGEVRLLWERSITSPSIFSDIPFTMNDTPNRFGVMQWASITIDLLKAAQSSLDIGHPMFKIDLPALVVPILNGIVERLDKEEMSLFASPVRVDTFVNALNFESAPELASVAARIALSLPEEVVESFLFPVANRLIELGPNPSDATVLTVLLDRLDSVTFIDKLPLEEYWLRLQLSNDRSMIWHLRTFVSALIKSSRQIQ